MQESGGRRIKRSILIDQQSIHFLSDDERKRLHRFNLMDEYLHKKQKDIDEWNQKLAEWGKEPVNTRRITNIGSFRAYVTNYLRNHPSIHQNYTLMSRQLEPTANGLPLEIYCFTNTTNWIEYEGIASDIFDHLLAILPESVCVCSSSPVVLICVSSDRGCPPDLMMTKVPLLGKPHIE